MTPARREDSEREPWLAAGRLANLAAAALRAEAFVVGRTVFLSRRAARAVANGSREGRMLLAHERAHVDQYRRHGVPGFLLRYLSDYVRARARGRSHPQAYAEIAFEREASERARALGAEGGGDTRRPMSALSREGSRVDPRRGA